MAATSELDKINKKKNHITHTTPPTHKQAASREMLASTIQFSHNTPTSNKHHHNEWYPSTSQAHKKGDNAPDTQQCTNDLPINFTSCMHGHFYACHKAPFKHSVLSIKVYVLPGISIFGGSRTLAHSTTNPHNTVGNPHTVGHGCNCSPIKSSLERR